ncbi:hypothetical protein FA13DRAFT_1794581 [Coprinellus micaceus]|uniref:Uncharacterized protein n=1 Tax=Coprinellus micaceus TaxID=71717 RepID=A0A4Y7T0H1_COPMI|nr:hypothetical protein FA13DRAFT_1794581 [Coprinellus micaceus]
MRELRDLRATKTSMRRRLPRTAQKLDDRLTCDLVDLDTEPVPQPNPGTRCRAAQDEYSTRYWRTVLTPDPPSQPYDLYSRSTPRRAKPTLGRASNRPPRPLMRSYKRLESKRWLRVVPPSSVDEKKSNSPRRTNTQYPQIALSTPTPTLREPQLHYGRLKDVLRAPEIEGKASDPPTPGCDAPDAPSTLGKPRTHPGNDLGTPAIEVKGSHPFTDLRYTSNAHTHLPLKGRPLHHPTPRNHLPNTPPCPLDHQLDSESHRQSQVYPESTLGPLAAVSRARGRRPPTNRMTTIGGGGLGVEGERERCEMLQWMEVVREGAHVVLGLALVDYEASVNARASRWRLFLKAKGRGDDWERGREGEPGRVALDLSTPKPSRRLANSSPPLCTTFKVPPKAQVVDVGDKGCWAC